MFRGGQQVVNRTPGGESTIGEKMSKAVREARGRVGGGGRRRRTATGRRCRVHRARERWCRGRPARFYCA